MKAGDPVKIGFIGAGQMARALAAGLLRAGFARPDALAASDPSAESAAAFREAAPGAATLTSNTAVAAGADVLFLAVKPQQISGVLVELRPAISSRTLIISIAAGVPLATLADGLGGHARLVRVMPNTPCLVGQSASGYSMGPGTSAEDAALVDRMLSAVGRAFRLEERLLDAVTGLAGAGPAFVYLVIEALSDGGVRMGLPRDVALALAAQTVRGAADMVLLDGRHPAVLKDSVTSPGGATIAGLHVLEAGSLRGLLMGAVEAAARRSRELGGGK